MSNAATTRRLKEEASERYAEAESLARRRSFLDRDDPESREAARDLLSREMHEIRSAEAAERWASYGSRR